MNRRYESYFVLFVLYAVFALAGCTRAEEDASRIRVAFPPAAVQIGSVKKVSAQSTHWQLADPTTSSQINCYAVMISAPDLESANHCKKLDGTKIASPQYVAGGFAAGTEQVLVVPAGMGRRLDLVGFATDDVSLCRDIRSGTGLAGAHFSAPRILSSVTMNLRRGPVDVTLTVPSTLASAEIFEDCAPLSFAQGASGADVLPTLSLASVSVSEGVGTAQLTATLSKPAVEDITFSYASTVGTATAADFTAASGTATISAGTLSTTIPVTIANDILDEDDESLAITLSGISINALGGQVSANVTIQDDDASPTLNLGSATATFAEGVGQASFSVIINRGSGRVVTVPYTVTGTANATDHALVDGVATIAVGSSAGTVTFNITNDALLEAPETIIVTLGTPVSATAGTTLSQTITITDDDAPVASIAGAPASFSSATTLSVTVGGAEVTHYQHAIVSGGTCPTPGAYGALTPVATTITDSITGLADGLVTLCVLGKSSSGTMQTTPTTVTWTKDLVAPTASLTGTPAAVSNVPALNIDVGGTGVTHYRYKIDSSATCSTAAGYGAEVSESVNITDSPGDGTRYVCVIARDAAGNYQAFGSATFISYLKDTVPPTAPSNLSNRVYGTSHYISPFYFWSPSMDTNSVSHYEVAIGTSLGGSDVYAWTNSGTLTGFISAASTFTDGVTYYLSVRARDGAGNISSLATDAWVVSTTPAWSQEAYVKTTTNVVSQEVGSAVAIDGDYMVVGVPLDDSNQNFISNDGTSSANSAAADAGAAYVYRRVGTTWSQIAYLKAPNVGAGDMFGASVAIRGDTIVVGAPMEDSNFTGITNGTSADATNSLSNSGAAYVFRYNGTLWAQEAYIKAPNAGANNKFGSAVAIDQDTILVSAPYENGAQTASTVTAGTNSGATNAGAVYAYRRSGTTWSFEYYLKAPNAQAYDNFGSRLAFRGDTAVIGAPAEDSNQTTITNGGGTGGVDSAADSGAAYVFFRTGTTWAQQAYLKASNAQASDAFGDAVGIFGDTIVVGSWSEDAADDAVINGTSSSADNSASDAGAAYVFHRTGTSWVQQAYLKASNSDANDGFGGAVAVFGSTIVVGAGLEDACDFTPSSGADSSANNGCSAAGAAYVYQRTGNNWSQERYLKAPNSGNNDQFGYQSVDVSGSTIIVGAPGEASNLNFVTNGSTASGDNSSSVSGAVYVFEPQ